MLLLRQLGVGHNMRVVPLFETRSDLPEPATGTGADGHDGGNLGGDPEYRLRAWQEG
jgi:hypothetical protein